MEWKTVKLGEIVILHDSKRVPLSSLERAKRKGNYPYYGAASIVDYIDSYIFDGDYILLGEDGTVINDNGTPVLQRPSGQFWVSNHAHVITNREGVDFDFLYYLLCNTNITSAVTGAVQMKVSQKNLLNIELPLPPLDTQRHIAAVLSSLDDKIENNNRINRNLEAQAQALFKSWFVDFEPWGGTMPEDWKEGTIADLVNLLNGFAFKSSDFVANGFYNLITIKGVQDGKMTTDGADHLDATPAKMPNWCLLKKGDILLSLTGNVGRCCLVDIENCLLNQRVAKLQPRAEYNRLFVYTLFRQEEMKSRMISISRGTAQMNLSPIETGKLSIIVPTDKVLEDFGMRYNGILDTILNNISESHRLATLRDTLLPKLMKGEITL